MIVNPQTQLNMVIGYPLHHTQSPLLHNTIYNNLNINAVLLAFAHKKLPSLVNTIKTLFVPLTAVTVPFKVTVLNYLDEWGEEVEQLQSANTLIQINNKLIGYNTDIDGVAYALRRTPLNGSSALIIGAGGAARSAAYILKKNNAKLFWLNRTKKNVTDLIKLFGGERLTLEEINNMPIDLIINTTPVGMYPQVNASPLAEYNFLPHQTVFDMVYNPVQTCLLIKAQLQGAKIISGLDMFIAQGLRQIELWQNKKIISGPLIKKLKKFLAGEKKR